MINHSDQMGDKIFFIYLSQGIVSKKPLVDILLHSKTARNRLDSAVEPRSESISMRFLFATHVNQWLPLSTKFQPNILQISL